MSSDPKRNLILGIVAQNENQILESASEGMGSFFTILGYRYHIINMFNPSGGEELRSALTSGQVAFAYGYAGVGSQLKLKNDVNVWTAARTPFVCLWFDHPAYNYLQHIVDSPYVIHCYHVRDHYEAKLKYLPVSSSLNTMVSLVPHVMMPHVRPTFSSREHKILFVKTGSDPDIISSKWGQHSKAVQDTLWQLAECAKKDRNLDLMALTVSLFAENKLPLDNLRLFMGVVEAADNYIRIWRSDRLARALLPHKATIIGRGWDYLKDISHKAVFCSSVPAQEFYKLVANSRVIANSSPLWRDGIHERVILGFCFGSVVLTDRTEKSDTVFGGLPNYIGFDWQDSLNQVISTALTLAAEDRDYIPATEEALNAWRSLDSLDYWHQILQAVEKVQINTDSKT